MWPGLGVVPDLRVVKRDFSQKSAPCELAQRVVDRSKGWGEVERARLVVERLRGEMPVACAEDHAGAQRPRESRPSPILKQALPPPLGCGSYADSRQPATPGRRPGRLPDAQT